MYTRHRVESDTYLDGIFTLMVRYTTDLNLNDLRSTKLLREFAENVS